MNFVQIPPSQRWALVGAVLTIVALAQLAECHYGKRTQYHEQVSSVPEMAIKNLKQITLE